MPSVLCKRRVLNDHLLLCVFLPEDLRWCLVFSESTCGLSEAILWSQRVKFPAVYGTKKLIALFKSAIVGSVAWLMLLFIYLFIFKNIIPKYRFSKLPTHTQNMSYLPLFHTTVVARTPQYYIIHILLVVLMYNIILCIAWRLSLLTCSVSPYVLMCSWSTYISCA
jgi:hypothetical protein